MFFRYFLILFFLIPTSSLALIEVNNSFQDAIDLHFSNLTIASANVINSGNDCLDVSGGSYKLFEGVFNKCSDKGISIGEKSEFSTDSIMVGSSNTGVSVKDLSVLNIRKAKITNTKICIEAVQKKQEFGGGLAKIVELDCQNKNVTADQSSIISLRK